MSDVICYLVSLVAIVHQIAKYIFIPTSITITGVCLMSYVLCILRLQVSKFIFDCLQLNTPTIFHNWFTLNHTIHNYNTRSTFFDIDNEINSNNLFIISARTTHYGLKLLKVSSPKIWNLIPNHIRSTQSVYSFKRILKKHMIAQYAS